MLNRRSGNEDFFIQKESMTAQYDMVSSFKDEIFQEIFRKLGNADYSDKRFISSREIQGLTDIIQEEIRNIIYTLPRSFANDTEGKRIFVKDALDEGTKTQLMATYIARYFENGETDPKQQVSGSRRYKLVTKDAHSYHAKNLVFGKDHRQDPHHHLKKEVGGKDGKQNEIILPRWFHELIHELTDLGSESRIKEGLLSLNRAFEVRHDMPNLKRELMNIAYEITELQKRKHALLLDPEYYFSVIESFFHKKNADYTAMNRPKQHWIFELHTYLEKEGKEKVLQCVMDEYAANLLQVVWNFESSILALTNVLQKHIFETKKAILSLLETDSQMEEKLQVLLVKYLISLGDFYKSHSDKIVYIDDKRKSKEKRYSKREKTKKAMGEAMKFQKYKKPSSYESVIERLEYFEKRKDESQTRLSSREQRQLSDTL